jgi:hypothetical protein
MLLDHSYTNPSAWYYSSIFFVHSASYDMGYRILSYCTILCWTRIRIGYATFVSVSVTIVVLPCGIKVILKGFQDVGLGL